MVGMPGRPEADATFVKREMPGLDGQVVDRASIHPVQYRAQRLRRRGPGTERNVPVPLDVRQHAGVAGSETMSSWRS